jgi:prepilin-type N-terminal cleavage/methylation domain-containing protein
MARKQNSFEAMSIIAHKQPRHLAHCLLSKGFTAIELIIVIVVLSILTISMIVKNPFSIKDYSSIAADQLIADIQYVQMRAMGTRNTQAITFRINATDYGIYNVAGSQKKLPGDIAVTYTNFTGSLTFNSLGEPGGSSNGNIYLSGGKAAGGQTVTVYTSTGKAEIE